MNTQEVADRIVDALKNMHPAQQGRRAPMVETVKRVLDKAQAEHESCEPATVAKGIGS